MHDPMKSKYIVCFQHGDDQIAFVFTEYIINEWHRNYHPEAFLCSADQPTR